MDDAEAGLFKARSCCPYSVAEVLPHAIPVASTAKHAQHSSQFSGFDFIEGNLIHGMTKFGIIRQITNVVLKNIFREEYISANVGLRRIQTSYNEPTSIAGRDTSSTFAIVSSYRQAVV